MDATTGSNTTKAALIPSLSVASNMWSVVLGWLDQAFLLLKLLGPARPKFFRNGFGNPSIQTKYFERVEEFKGQIAEGTYSFQLRDDDHDNDEKDEAPRSNASKITWGPIQTLNRGRITLQEGSFPCPLAELVPKEVGTAYVYRVRPTTTTHNNSNNKVAIIMLAATGEATIGARFAMAQSLALEFGWSTLIHLTPYYGKRKPKDQTLFCINSTTDIVLQGESIIEEAAALGQYVLDTEGPSSLVCWTGYSFGAAMASCASALALNTCKNADDGKRMACAPYVGCASPCVFSDGVLEISIDWNAFQACGGDYETRRRAVFDELSKTSLSLIENIGTSSNPRRFGVVRAMNMWNDAFIRPVYALALEDEMKASHQSIRQEWIWQPGGHVWAAIVRPLVQKKLIVDTVKQLIRLHDDNGTS